MNIWQGAIMGVSASDSSGLYFFAECLNVQETYRLIWVPKGGFSKRRLMTAEDLRILFEEGRSNSYVDFDIYCFVVPLVDSESMDDQHADHTKYPVTVTALKRLGNSWMFLSSDTARNLAEFGSIQMKVIFDSSH